MAQRPRRERADKLLVAQGLAETREKAKALILAGSVTGYEDQRIDKPGELIATTIQLRVKDRLPYVSRGGLKLAGAIEAFDIDFSGARVLDVGASTGGFTDCALQHGASSVVAVDVGYGQLDWKLRQDPRVTVVERCNIRHATSEQIKVRATHVVIDVSFISLTKVLTPALRFAEPNVRLVCLVKPQFEVGAEHVGKGGIVRDEKARLRALESIRQMVQELGFEDILHKDSPILGAKGNREYLLVARRRT